METNLPNKQSVQLSYPTDKLVAIIDAMPDAEQARPRSCSEAGFAPDAIGIQHGTPRPSRYCPCYTDLIPFPHLARLLHVGSIEHRRAGRCLDQVLRQGQSVNRCRPCAEGGNASARAAHLGGAQTHLH